MFISNAISDHEMSFEITIKHNFWLKLGKSYAYWASTQFTRMLIKKKCTKDQLLIDKAIMENFRRRKVGLSMVWIDYQKAYDMVPHSWIKKSMGMCGVADNISHFLSKSMESWQPILK